MDRRSKIFLLFLLAILAGISMRIYGLRWGLPYHFNGDERFVISMTEKFRSAESLNQLADQEMYFFLYPPLLVYILSALIKIVSFFRPFDLTEPTSITLYYLLGRIVTACFSIATLLLVYRMGKRFYNQSVGMLASVFLAFSVLHIRDSHFYLPEVPYTFFVVLATFLSMGIAEKARTRSYLLTGIATGIGLTIKQTTLMVFPVILTAHVVGMFRNLQISWNSCRRIFFSLQSWRLLLLPVLIAGLIFLLLNPFIFLNPQKFLEMLQILQGYVTGTDQPNWTFQFTDTTRLYWFTNLLYFGMGPLLELTCVIGMIWALVKRKVPDLLLLSFLLPYLYFIGGGYMKFIRYAVPLLPFLCLLGARFLLDLYEMATHKVARIAVITSIIVVTLASFLYALAYMNIYSRGDVRIKASKWIHKNIPQNSSVLIDSSPATPLLGSTFYNVQLDNYYSQGWRDLYYKRKDYFKIKVLNLRTVDLIAQKEPISMEWWENYLKERLEGVEYIIMSDQYYDLYSHRPDEYPTLNQFYRDLFAGRLGFQLIKTFKTYPALLGFNFNDDRAEITFRWFDHPKVMIFKRIQAQDQQN